MAVLVRETLEDKRTKNIKAIKLESTDEDFTNDAFIQTLTFNITIKNGKSN